MANNNNQQAVQKFFGDFALQGSSSVQNVNGVQVISYSSTFAIAFACAKQIAIQLHGYDQNNELWQKMLFEVSFDWIRRNKEQFKRELERYQEQLLNAVIARVHPTDLRWMKTYVKIMLDILNSELN